MVSRVDHHESSLIIVHTASGHRLEVAMNHLHLRLVISRASPQLQNPTGNLWLSSQLYISNTKSMANIYNGSRIVIPYETLTNGNWTTVYRQNTYYPHYPFHTSTSPTAFFLVSWPAWVANIPSSRSTVDRQRPVAERCRPCHGPTSVDGAWFFWLQ